MAENSNIEWTDHTASPWHGCSKVAVGCENCYAARQAVRNPGTLGIWGDDGTRVKSKSFIDNLRAWNKQAAKDGTTVSVFPSICDPFEDRPELVPWREEMFAVADECPNVRLLLLTKRPENVAKMWPTAGFPDAGVPGTLGRRLRLENVWVGTSIACQADADRNIPELLKCRELSPVLFLSCEPLVGPVNIAKVLITEKYRHYEQFEPDDLVRRMLRREMTHAWIDWCIVGGESGPGARPFDPAWARSIVQQCEAAGVACFVKQMGANVVTRNDQIEDVFNNGASGWPDPEVEHHIHGFREDFQGADCRIILRDKKGGDWSEWPEDLRVRQMPEVSA